MNRPATELKEFSEYTFTPVTVTPENTRHAKLDAILARLQQGAKGFAGLSIDARIALLNDMQAGFLNVAPRLVRTACKAKNIVEGTPVEAEEWGAGPVSVIRQLRLLRESLEALQTSGKTPTGKTGRTIDDRLSVQLFPMDSIDKLLFKDVTVDVHMQAGVTEDQVKQTCATYYKHPDHQGRVALVLGAGNITAIPPMDVITKMFNEGKACILKMNPVNAYAGPYIEEAFASAIEKNYLAVVYGDVKDSQYLVNHEQVDEIHITGSDKTHDHIVWGPPGPERNQRITDNTPVINKPITSELGCVTPVIVVPGPYKEKELAYQARDVCGAFTFNAAFLCCVPVLLVTSRGWSQRTDFLDYIDNVLASTHPRKAYYPGASERWQLLSQGKDKTSKHGAVKTGQTPWTLIRGLSPEKDEPLYANEPFCSILAETTLPTKDPVEFLEAMVEFVNQRLWGSLTANMIIHPASLRDPVMGKAIEQAITKLKYGTVTINGFNGMSFMFGTPPWGAYPGSSLKDIQSGRGWVHNTCMLEGIEKTVIRFPLTTFPKPSWHPGHKTAHQLLARLSQLETHHQWARVPGVVWTAMRG